MSVIPALGRLSKEDHKFMAKHGGIVNLCLRRKMENSFQFSGPLKEFWKPSDIPVVLRLWKGNSRYK